MCRLTSGLTDRHARKWYTPPQYARSTRRLPCCWCAGRARREALVTRTAASTAASPATGPAEFPADAEHIQEGQAAEHRIDEPLAELVRRAASRSTIGRGHHPELQRRLFEEGVSVARRALRRQPVAVLQHRFDGEGIDGLVVLEVRPPSPHEQRHAEQRDDEREPEPRRAPQRRTHTGVSLARWLGTADRISGCEDSVESAFQP